MIRHFALITPLILAACTAMVPSTALQLMSMSPLTADPEGLAVQIDLPGTVGIRDGSARFVIINTYQGATETYEFTLERQGNVYRIAAEDLQPLRDIQARISAQEVAEPRDNRGSLSIFASPCLKSDFADINDPVSVAIQTAPDGPFRPLFQNEPLSALFGPADLSVLPICDTP